MSRWMSVLVVTLLSTWISRRSNASRRSPADTEGETATMRVPQAIAPGLAELRISYAGVLNRRDVERGLVLRFVERREQAPDVGGLELRRRTSVGSPR